MAETTSAALAATPEPTAREHYLAKLAELTAEHTAATIDYRRAVATAKAQKARKTLAEDLLEELVNGGPEEMPLFDAPGRTAESGQTQSAAPDGEAPTLDLTWATEPVAALGVATGTCEKLAEAGIQTLGDLCERMTKGGILWYAEIAGVGELKASKISDALADYWRTHPGAGSLEADAAAPDGCQSPRRKRVRLRAALSDVDDTIPPGYEAGTIHEVLREEPGDDDDDDPTLFIAGPDGPDDEWGLDPADEEFEVVE